MRRIFSKGRNDERGVAALEFAFVLPVLMLIAFGVIDLARAVWTQTTLDYAVQAAARCGAVNTTTCSNATTIKNYTISQAYALPAGSITFPTPPSTTATCTTDVSGAAIKGVAVSASFAFTYYFPPFATFNPATFTAAACYPT